MKRWPELHNNIVFYKKSRVDFIILHKYKGKVFVYRSFVYEIYIIFAWMYILMCAMYAIQFE